MSMNLRLLQKLEDTRAKMDGSYHALAKYLTEIKMDHADGAKESDRLKEFLNCKLSVAPAIHPKHPKEDACEQ